MSKGSNTKESIDKLNAFLKVSNVNKTEKRRTVNAKKTKKKSTTAVPQSSTITSKTVEKINWADRKDIGKVILELGDASMEETDSKAHVHPTIIPKTPFRYMYDKVRTKSDALSNRLTDIGEILLEQNDLGYATPIVTNSGSECVFVGRILCESESGEGKLNATSVLLEGFNDEEQVRSSITKLDIRACKETFFFPGQIVALKGTKDVQKNTIKVSECFNQITFQDDHGKSEAHQTIIVAAGPFTTPDNLSYEPLDDLLTRAVEESASLVVLVGPFLSTEHEMVKNDELDDTYEEIFEAMCRKVTDRKLQVVMVPSLQDIHHDYVYPQPPFEIQEPVAGKVKQEKSDKKIITVTNPGSFSVDGIKIVATSHDILTQIKSVEYFLEKKPHSDIELTHMRIANLFAQKSLYPIFAGEWNVPFDSTLSHMLTLDTLPDVLILPTDSEAPFVLQVNGVLVINPKRLGTFDSDACLGGTYAKISVPSNSAAIDAQVQIKRV